ncbi:MAG TPA: class I SAM-dependent methyltransferase [Burkholderiales bacterium]
MARGPAELPKKLAAYVAAVGVRETAVQRRLRAVTRKLPRGSMQIGADQGAFMQVLVRAIGARRCLEVGTFTGYSALAVALALPPGGKIVCCDVSEEWTSVARRYWRQAGMQNKIRLHLAPALQTLKRLKGQFDFAFIDADKANLQAYFERCLKLVRRGGLVAIDNTLWHGTVIQPRDKSVDARAVRAFNRRLRRDRRVEIALVPIGDGLTLAWKR